MRIALAQVNPTVGAIDANTELVMHFAAFTYVGESMSDPLKYYENNLAGTVHDTIFGVRPSDVNPDSKLSHLHLFYIDRIFAIRNDSVSSS